MDSISQYFLSENFKMINLEVVLVGELLKIQDHFAVVTENTGVCLYVRHLRKTNKLYQGSHIYEFDKNNKLINSEDIQKHFRGIIDPVDINMTHVGHRRYIETIDIDTDSE